MLARLVLPVVVCGVTVVVIWSFLEALGPLFANLRAAFTLAAGGAP